MPSKKNTKSNILSQDQLSIVSSAKISDSKPNITFTIQPLPKELGSHVTIPKPGSKSKIRPSKSDAGELVVGATISGPETNNHKHENGAAEVRKNLTNVREDGSRSKSKGGKIVSKIVGQQESSPPITNVILHLKCTIADLTEYTTKMNRMVKNELIYNPEVPPEIHTYTPNDKIDFANYNENTTDCQTDNEKNDKNRKEKDLETVGAIWNECHIGANLAYSENSLLFSPGSKNSAVITTPYNVCRICAAQTDNDPSINTREINQKLKTLKINLYKNTLHDKKSACFWCTYDFDNQPCYIPKYETDGKIYGYGSFCRPECAVAYLMKENLDDSTKFERYHLLNHTYSKVYSYNKNIKPAPNPYYLLEKYFGNLTIQEYRKLLSTEHLLTVIEKPMSRILPELFEDNDHFILGIYGNNAKPSTQKNVYKVKRQSEKNAAQTPSKNSIMKEQFGLA